MFLKNIFIALAIALLVDATPTTTKRSAGFVALDFSVVKTPKAFPVTNGQEGKTSKRQAVPVTLDTIDPRQRCVAIWTYNTPESEEQYISYSLDGGACYTFTEYQKNPVLAAGSTQFRDPKVFWYPGEPSQKWIMTAAKSQDYKIEIYSSDDLKSWKLESAFANEGFLGYQYECPGLIEVPTEQDPSKSYWVMFISINPGAPAGGSFNQYFVGSDYKDDDDKGGGDYKDDDDKGGGDYKDDDDKGGHHHHHH
nr:N-glycosylation reporter 3 [synthetic construct]